MAESRRQGQESSQLFALCPEGQQELGCLSVGLRTAPLLVESTTWHTGQNKVQLGTPATTNEYEGPTVQKMANARS